MRQSVNGPMIKCSFVVATYVCIHACVWMDMIEQWINQTVS